MADKKECFIIMPITTPQIMLEKYRDGSEHFKHVLECLFIPAIEKADFKPKPPISKGGDLIHAQIVNNLETASIVLCDMSTLNPNVFFEFGIRTALNKPICLVKDEFVDKVPFDAGIINYHEYDSKLELWNSANEIKKLAEHLKIAFERSKGVNEIWKYFGIKAAAVPSKIEDSVDAKTDYLVSMMQTIAKKFDSMSSTVSQSQWKDFERVLQTPAGLKRRQSYEISTLWIRALAPESATVDSVAYDGGNSMVINYSGEWSKEDKEQLVKYINEALGKEVHVEFSELLF